MPDPAEKREPQGSLTPSLDKLIGGVPGNFLRDQWPDRYAVAHGDIRRLPEIFQNPLLHDVHALAGRYAGPTSFGRGTRDARTLDIHTHPSNLLKLGLSIYLHDIAGCLEGARAFVHGLERELELPFGCGRIAAFASPAEEGVSCHFDTEEVFSVQLLGTKRIEIARVGEIANPWGGQFGPGMLPADSLYPQISMGFPDPSAANFDSIEMCPGSVLFIPRGHWHRTQAGENSLSISVIFRPPAAFESVLQQLQLLLLQDPQWRRPLFGMWGSGSNKEEAVSTFKALLARLPAAAAQLTSDNITTATEEDILASTTADSRFQRVPMSRYEIQRGSQKNELALFAWGSDWIERPTWRTVIDLTYEPILKVVDAAKDPLSARDLARKFPSVPVETLAQFLRSLARWRFLRPLWFPSFTDKGGKSS